MASVQKKGNAWYRPFLYRRQRHTFAVGEVDMRGGRSLSGYSLAFSRKKAGAVRSRRTT
jgi:hypothetical protein